MEEKKESVWESLVKLFVLTLVLIPFTYTCRGWALKVLWGWFLVPFGVAQIGVAHAIGICAATSLLTSKARMGDNSWSGLWTATGAAVVIPLLAVAVGWVAHSWMVP